MPLKKSGLAPKRRTRCPVLFPSWGAGTGCAGLAVTATGPSGHDAWSREHSPQVWPCVSRAGLILGRRPACAIRVSPKCSPGIPVALGSLETLSAGLCGAGRSPGWQGTETGLSTSEPLPSLPAAGQSCGSCRVYRAVTVAWCCLLSSWLSSSPTCCSLLGPLSPDVGSAGSVLPFSGPLGRSGLSHEFLPSPATSGVCWDECGCLWPRPAKPLGLGTGVCAHGPLAQARTRPLCPPEHSVLVCTFLGNRTSCSRSSGEAPAGWGGGRRRCRTGREPPPSARPLGPEVQALGTLAPAPSPPIPCCRPVAGPAPPLCVSS